MATELNFMSGRQITDGNGAPQAGAKLHFYREGTTTDLTVWMDDGEQNAHAQPVVCDAGGFVPLIYVDHQYDYKIVITDAADATLRTYDNLPKTVDPNAGSTDFNKYLMEWSVQTDSVLDLETADLGKGYLLDTTSNNITVNLPSAVSTSNGKGFVFKKAANANIVTIDPDGSEGIEGSSTAVLARADDAVWIISDGQAWRMIAVGSKRSGVPDAILVDQKTAGTPGGTFSSGDWYTRDLNTERYNPDGIAVLSSNQFTLRAGTYYIIWAAPAYHVSAHKTRLYNVTDSSVVVDGKSSHSHDAAGATQSDSTGSAVVTISSDKTFRIEHSCINARATNGFGLANNFSGAEVYTMVEITRMIHNET